MKLRVYIAVILMALIALPSSAKEKTSEEKARKEIKERVDKDTRKDAKAREKDGWKCVSGSLTLEKQIHNCKIATQQKDNNGEPVWMVGKHTAIGANYSIAKSIATTRAKAELASNIKAEIKKSARSQTSQSNLSTEDNTHLDKIIEAIAEDVVVNVKELVTLIEVFRERDNQKVELEIQLAINYSLVRKETMSTLNKELKKSAAHIAKKLNIK